MNPWLEIDDDIGPHKVLAIRDPGAGLSAILVVDNVAAGPAIGGLRMSPTVTIDEVARLARAMTLKAAIAGIRHGGAKAGIVSRPDLGELEKERLIRAFARAIADETDYIPGPDMGTDERCMAYVHDEIGRAAGLPRVIGGIPLDEIGATGFGLSVCARAAQSFADLDLREARIAVQGFGSVGLNAARFLSEQGAAIVAAGDRGGAVFNPEGLDVAALIAHKRRGRSVHDFSGGKPITGEQLVGIPCDVWIPAAQPDVINAANHAELKAKMVLCGANIPVTGEARKRLHERGVLVIPDVVANAGGLICAAVEVAGGSQRDALAIIEERIAANTGEVLERARAEKLSPQRAAERLAESRVREAMSYRRKGIRVPHPDPMLGL